MSLTNKFHHVIRISIISLITLCTILAQVVPVFASVDYDHHDHDEMDMPLILKEWFESAVGQAGDLEAEYESQSQRLQANRAEQDRLKKQIADAQYRERSLQEQIAFLDNRARLKELEIAVTEADITETQRQLEALSIDIEALQIKAGILNESINRLQRAYFARVRSSYEASFTPTLTIFLSSESFQSAVLKFAYLKNLQEEDNKFLSQLKTTKGEYQKRTDELESLKGQNEKLKEDLEGQRVLLHQHKTQLAQEQNSKQYLLHITNNEEAQYQRMLALAQAEQRAIEDALNKVLQQITGRVLEGTRVSVGDIVGIQGNTGYSTGEHLHFGYYPCGGWSCPADPMGLLNSGSFRWPLDNFDISQGFGITPFAQTGAYGYDSAGRPIGHNGVDMVGPTGSPVKAAHNGTVYYTVDGWGGHGAILIDDSGFMTIYWHLRPRG